MEIRSRRRTGEAETLLGAGGAEGGVVVLHEYIEFEEYNLCRIFMHTFRVHRCFQFHTLGLPQRLIRSNSGPR